MKTLIISFSRYGCRAVIFALAVFVSGCVSASLDDVGLSSNSQAETANNSLPQTVSAHELASQPDENVLQSSVTAANSDVAAGQTASVVASKDGELESINQQARQQGIAEIRAKAEATGNVRPQINDIAVSTAKHLTTQEQALSKAELRAEALAAQGLISDAELAARHTEIAALRKKARLNFDKTVQQIEN